MNKPLEMSMIVGWCCACHLKTHLMASFHQFPVLGIWGGAGAGKSVTANLVTWLNGTDFLTRDTAVNVANITEFAVREYAASTTTIPRVMEEYNKSKMRSSTYKTVGETMKASWNGERILRGNIGSRKEVGSRTGAVLSQIPITGPIIAISEQEITMPALQERSIRVKLSKESRKGRRPQHREANKGREYLRKIGKAMMATTLQTTLADVEVMMDYAEEKLTPELDDRIRYSYLVSYLGLKFLKTVVDTHLHLDKSSAKLTEMLQVMDEYFLDLETNLAEVAARSEVDQVIEDMALMGAMMGANNQYWLQSGTHYVLDRERGLLWLYLPVAHALYVKYHSSINRGSVVIDSGKQLAKLLGDEAYYDGVEMRDMDGRVVQMTRLKVSVLEDKNVDISHFESI